MKERERAIALAELALLYLDHQDALGQPEETLDRKLEDEAKSLLRRFGRESTAPPGPNRQS